MTYTAERLRLCAIFTTLLATHFLWTHSASAQVLGTLAAEGGEAECIAGPISLAVRADCADWNTRGFFRQADVAQVDACLDAGADPDARADNGMTPLHHAAIAADHEVTPLHWAASDSNDPAVIEALIAGGADVNAADVDGLTPLHWAAEESATPAVITALLAAGADPARRDSQGDTPWDLVQSNDDLLGTPASEALRPE